jgi:hypothetical protein
MGPPWRWRRILAEFEYNFRVRPRFLLHMRAPVWIRTNGLSLLFLFLYVLLSMLVIEQGRTIESQKQLIRELFHDSQQLNAMRIREAQAGR